MHSSPKDPLNTVFSWFQGRTYQATRQQDWTPEDNLYVDYQRHAEAAGIKPSKRMSRAAFRTELQALTRRAPQNRLAKAIGSSQERYVACWPRVLRHPAKLYTDAAVA
jgi:hypothetical protein